MHSVLTDRALAGLILLQGMMPTEEELGLIKGFDGDVESLAPAERWFHQLLRIPRPEHWLRVATRPHTVDLLSPLSPHHRLSAGHLCLARGRLWAGSAAQPQPARAARLGASTSPARLPKSRQCRTGAPLRVLQVVTFARIFDVELERTEELLALLTRHEGPGRRA